MTSVLLIDDSDADNFFHKITIKKSTLCEKVETFTSAAEALKRLTTAAASNAEMPDIILLDINIPLVDGWEFLERYGREVDEAHRTPKIFMLSTSLNPKDRVRAEEHPLVEGYYSKPLETKSFIEMIKHILEHHG